jgi:hypothetical protein
MIKLLHKYKYEVLLLGLIQHLYIGVFLSDMVFYTKVVWPTNMLILGMASVGVFIEKGKWKNIIKNFLTMLVIFLPISVPFFGNSPLFMFLLTSIFCLFYAFIFIEVLRYLLKPSYINRDIITASACGYFLLIEIAVFLMQNFYYTNPDSFKGMGHGFSVVNSANNYIDLVYFCTITITSIGFGDITPNTHYTKLLTSLFGVIGQFYSVVLVGILISKFTSSNDK